MTNRLLFHLLKECLSIPVGPVQHQKHLSYRLATHLPSLYLIWGLIDEELSSLDKASISTCVISYGELIFGAYKSERVRDNLRAVLDFWKDIIVHKIDDDTAIIYGKLKNEILERFGPRDRPKRRGFKIGSLGLKDNDLWIASVAIQHDLILVSADSDAVRLSGIEGLKVENW